MVTFIYLIDGHKVDGDVYIKIVDYLFANAIDKDNKRRWSFKEFTVRSIDESGKIIVESDLQFRDNIDLKNLFFDIINKADLSTLFEPVNKIE